ncbi:MAG: hypothetical protein ACK4K7_10770 [Allosphingosinicella sp.]|uniref:hypothetical protein n=1 Tax=Allosphingosinicella sp. TaxID=2823234 RepID=UPI003956EF11
MTTLMGFILNTVQPRVNDPANTRMWLPALLMQLRNDDGSPTLPIHAGRQDLGALTGTNGGFVADTFNSVYSIMNQVDTKPDPDAMFPLLTLPNVTLDGLQNMKLADTSNQPTPDGYVVHIDLAFDAYQGEVGGNPMPPLTFSGRYEIEQKLEVIATGEKVTITGHGSFTVVVTDCKLVATAGATISGTGAGRVNTIAVSALEIVGTSPTGPALNFTNLTLDDDLPQKAQLMATIQDALSDPQAAGAFLSAINEMLSAQENLESVNRLLSDKTTGVLDGIFGPLPASGLPVDGPDQKALTPVDQFLFDRVRLSLADPGSSWFLPLQLASSDDPVLEPYSNPQVDVPDQTIKGLVYSGIVLTDVLLAGASNAAAPLDQTILATTSFSTRVALGSLPEGPAHQVPRQGGSVSMPVPPAPPLTFSARFSLVQQGFKPVPLKGTLVATIENVFVNLTMTPSGADVDHLTMTMSQVSADVSAARIAPSVSLDPPNGPLEQILDALFAKSDVQQQVLAALNTALAEQQGAISEQFTQIARNAILSQLGN